jgi:glycosyltransferase involved in cell wall biosynthesis
MMTSVIIPVYKEKHLDHTIDNLFTAASGNIEVVVFLNAYQDVDYRAKIIKSPENVGERKAMNAAAKEAKGDYLFRLDGHCEMSEGWDKLLIESCKPRGIAISSIIACDENFKDLPGFYTCCKLLPNMEEKWWTRKTKDMVVPTMAFTGCGWMIRRDYYLSFGGADERLPMMGAIGPEFALQAWLDGDGCVVRKDVECKHIFGTGGFNACELVKAGEMLKKKWGNRYDELLNKFPDADIERDKMITKRIFKTKINKTDYEIERDQNGEVISVFEITYKPFIVEHDGSKDEKQIEAENIDKITEVEKREEITDEKKIAEIIETEKSQCLLEQEAA